MSLLAAWSFAFVLTAAQVAPTWRLARLAADAVADDYLSGFATPPPHLISYLVPELFHRSQLWRPVVSGSVPLLARGTSRLCGTGPAVLGIVNDRSIVSTRSERRLLTIIAVATLILGSGPFLPGFRWYSHLPGFSFFRPGALGDRDRPCLAILAGKGFTKLDEWKRVARSLAIFAVASASLIALALGLLAFFIVGGDRPEAFEVCDAVCACFRLGRTPRAAARFGLKLKRDKGRISRPGKTCAFKPLMRERLGPFPKGGESLRERFQDICVLELSETAALLLGLLAIVAVGRDPKRLKIGCLLIIIIDLFMLSRHRLVNLGPIEAARAGSPVLERLATRPGGARSGRWETCRWRSTPRRCRRIERSTCRCPRSGFARLARLA